MHILFVDDIDDTRVLFVFAFRLAGHTATGASNGLEGIAAVEEEVYDAIIMDVGMPLMDGIEATRRIRELPNGRAVPILVLTAHPEEAICQRALAAGANVVLHKPTMPQELVTQIEQLVNSS